MTTLPLYTEDNRYQYNGKEFEQVANLLDYGWRWYDPVIGRWGGVDPLAEWAPQLTPFRYGFNNPISFTDPDGLFETRREARVYRRENSSLNWRNSSIVENKHGTFDIRDKNSQLTINKNNEGEIEYSASASYTGPSISAYKQNFFEGVQNSGFVGNLLYGLANDAWLTTQRLNPLDNHTTHLSGHFASKDEYTMGLVNTVAATVPIGRGLTPVQNVMPMGLTPLSRLNAAEFSSLFKGTFITRLHPQIRGKLNRTLNTQGIDRVNTAVETGGILFSGTRMVGNSTYREEQ